MTRQKQALLALAQEVMALYGKQLEPPTVPTAETSGQAQATRKLTVCEAWCCRRTVPSLRLQGQWLERAGFPAGTRVIVQVQEGKIVLLGCRKGE